MSKHRWLILLVVGGFLLEPVPAFAGMATPIRDDLVRTWLSTGLKENAIARLQNISFFLVGFLLSALFIKLLWNYLRKDWTFLPRLTYGKAVGVVFLWGLLFVLVLMMISGARELLTPGAWKTNGFTYRLADDPAWKSESEALENKRQEQLVQLRKLLWKHAKEHEGKLPDNPAAAGISEENMHVPDPSGMNYIYVKGLQAGQGNRPVLYEPDIFGPERYVLFTSGDIRRLKSTEIQHALAAVKP